MQGLVLTVQVVEFRVSGLGLKVYDLGYRVYDL